MIAPDLSTHIETFWPTSAIGWLTFGTIATALGKTVFDWLTGRRKSLSLVQDSIKAVDRKVDGLCSQVADMEGELTAVDGLAESVRELTQEWRGPPGSPNGFRSKILRNEERIGAIERRNYEIDAIKKAMDEDERRGHGQHRRLMDRELNNLLPEEREEKG